MDTGCFCILAIVRMLIHVGIQVSLEILSPSPLCIYPEVELLRHTVVLFFNVYLFLDGSFKGKVHKLLLLSSRGKD